MPQASRKGQCDKLDFLGQYNNTYEIHGAAGRFVCLVQIPAHLSVISSILYRSMDTVRNVAQYIWNLEWTEKIQHECLFCDRQNFRKAIFEARSRSAG